MIRVLFVNEIGEIAGTENLLTDIMIHLDRDRFTPLMACPSGPVADRLEMLGVKHIPFEFRLRRLKVLSRSEGVRRPINPVALAYKLIEAQKLAKIVRANGVDILHTNSLSAHLAGIFAANWTGTPILWHIHTLYPRLLFRFWQPDRIVFVSDFVRLQAFPNYLPSHAHIIHNGIQSERFDPVASPTTDIRAELGLSQRQPLVAMIGYLDPIKGQHEMLVAWQQVHSILPEAVLLLVGKAITNDGSGYKKYLEQLIHELQIEESVIFTGFRSDIPSILHAVDLYVSFTLNDTLSMMIIEAMMMGKAIIGANSGGVPELILDEETGLLVNREDIPGLAKAIVSLLKEPERRSALGQAARERALASFRIESCVEALASVYDEMYL